MFIRFGIRFDYLISSHPGATLKEAVELAEYLRNLGYMPEQVQNLREDLIGFDRK